MKPRSARHAMSWLDADPAFTQLGEHSRRMRELQRDVERCVPGLALSVLALERDALVIAVPHAGIAAKLRQHEPTLIEGLGGRGWRVARIRFKPLLPEPGTVPPAARAPKTALSPAAVAEVARLAAAVDAPSLKRALTNLARRHRAR